MDETPDRGEPVIVDQPQPGFWKMRLVPKGWHEVPVRICHDLGQWWALIDGAQVGAPHGDPALAEGVLGIWHSRKTPITLDEYLFLCGDLKEWAWEHCPDHPLLHPRDPIVLADMPPLPQFEAPPELAEPSGRNAPERPRPMNAEEIVDWLDYDNETLIAHIARDIDVLKSDADITITDDEELARVAGNVDIAHAHRREASEHCKLALDPFIKGERIIRGFFSDTLAKLHAAMAPAQAAMDDYAARVEAEEGRTLRIRNAYGRSTKADEEWGFEVADISRVPLQYLQINERLVHEAIKAFAKAQPDEARAGISPISGIRITRSLSVRSR